MQQFLPQLLSLLDTSLLFWQYPPWQLSSSCQCHGQEACGTWWLHRSIHVEQCFSFETKLLLIHLWSYGRSTLASLLPNMVKIWGKIAILGTSIGLPLSLGMGGLKAWTLCNLSLSLSLMDACPWVWWGPGLGTEGGSPTPYRVCNN